MERTRSAAAAAMGLVLALGGSALAQPDITICQLYGLSMTYLNNPNSPGRAGDTVGLALATTSWNIGNVNAAWYEAPNPYHPFIAQNLYILKDGRLRQIGLAWAKHGYFALSNLQCGGTCSSTNGTQLGVGCTDTYGSNLNGNQYVLGPRMEINPWTGGWSATGSLRGTSAGTDKIARRIQVKDADLDPSLNPGASWFGEGFYLASDDRELMNSGAWKEFTPVGASGGTYTFTMSPSSTPPTIGFAIDAWPGARRTLVAQSLPIIEAVNSYPGHEASPDGRAIVGCRATDNGDGTWRYEYAVFNIDMDRQVGAFTVPVPPGVDVTNTGFAAPYHHEEAYAWSEVISGSRVNGKAIDNLPWTCTVGPSSVSWSTPAVGAPEPSNPIRWGTMYNFWFDASTGPADGLVTLGLFRDPPPGQSVTSIDGLTDVPQAPPPFCFGDADGNRTVTFSDVTSVLANFGASYTPGSRGPGDANNDGFVNFADITAVLASFGVPCP